MSSISSRDDVFLGGVRVLVVDDSGPVRGLLTEILEQYGAAVTTVSSASEALEILAHERPDVLVSDLEMPDKDGYWLNAANPEYKPIRAKDRLEISGVMVGLIRKL